MVREYFAFQIVKIENKEEFLGNLYKGIPNTMKLVVVKPASVDKSIEYVPLLSSNAEFVHWNEFLVLDRRTSLPKVSLTWSEKEGRLIISPNHKCIPQEMFRTLNWNSLSAATLLVLKTILVNLRLNLNDNVLFCGKPLNIILWNKIQKKSRGLGVEFHLFWQEYIAINVERAIPVEQKEENNSKVEPKIRPPKAKSGQYR